MTRIPLTLLALLLLVLTGCGPGGGGESSSDGGAGSSAAAPEEGAEAGQEQTGGSDASDGSGSARGAVGGSSATAALQRAVVATGEVRVETRRVDRARDEVLRLTRAWGGLVADEQTSSDERGRVQGSTMVLRVPTPRFDAALAALADLGRATEQTRSAEDVTTQVVDTAARVRAAERSIRSIERLLGRAERLGDVIRIEGDLARRQADLDSLKQQQAYLADQTSLSTVTLHLERPVAAGPQPTEARGFVAGLRQGWDALVTLGVGAMTVVGTLLPFGVVLGLVLAPVLLVLRRRTRPGRPGAAPA